MILPVTFFLADAPPLPYPEAPEQSDRSTTKSERSRVRVLVVDDEQLIASTVAAILNIHGFEAEAPSVARRRSQLRAGWIRILC